MAGQRQTWIGKIYSEILVIDMIYELYDKYRLSKVVSKKFD
jgi:hypothetical protein